MAKLSNDGKTINTHMEEAHIGYCLAYYNNQVEKGCYSVKELQDRNYIDDTAFILALINETVEKSNNNNLAKAYKDIYNNAYVPQYNALAPEFGVKPIATIKDNELTR